jgi:hypothetical protein
VGQALRACPTPHHTFLARHRRATLWNLDGFLSYLS